MRDDEPRDTQETLRALVRTQTNLTIGLRQESRAAKARHEAVVSAIEDLRNEVREANKFERNGSQEVRAPTGEYHQVAIDHLNKRRTGDITGVIRIDDQEFHVRRKVVADLWKKLRPLVYSAALALSGLVGHKAKAIWHVLFGGP